MSMPSIHTLATIDGTIVGNLFADANGDVFGEANTGGAAPEFVFRVDGVTGDVTASDSMNYGTTGTGIKGGLAADGTGTLYGASAYGQTAQNGGLIAVDPATLTVTPLAGGSPVAPLGPPVVDAAGDAFFVSSAGDAVLKLAAGSSSFVTIATGAQTNAALAVDANGDVFGTTDSGANGAGSVFEIAANTNPTTALTVLDFNPAQFGGVQPINALVIDAAGNIYGDAQNLFEITADTHRCSSMTSSSQPERS